MPVHQWFVFDFGNVLIRLDYERMLGEISAKSVASRAQIVRTFEMMGGVRDLERGAATFAEFHDLLGETIQYSGTLDELKASWGTVLAGPVEGIEDLLDRVRLQYRVGFLSNTNETHVEQIFRRFGVMFREDDRFVFSHRVGCAKPDPKIFRQMLQQLGALASQIVYVDDLAENVFAALDMGITAYQFTSSLALGKELEEDGLLAAEDQGLWALLV